MFVAVILAILCVGSVNGQLGWPFNLLGMNYGYGRCCQSYNPCMNPCSYNYGYGGYNRFGYGGYGMPGYGGYGYGMPGYGGYGMGYGGMGMMNGLGYGIGMPGMYGGLNNMYDNGASIFDNPGLYGMNYGYDSATLGRPGLLGQGIAPYGLTPLRYKEKKSVKPEELEKSSADSAMIISMDHLLQDTKK
ncbi:unnamed protein product [Bursaphelenchus okinawaensis]|uniref:Uncharacterized protein n=1 Tax=Bursaphelenchus okinawaensis TaxID=465554 RepID=A0A811KV46_9BILA|nr:unnamed protein product [Bursaphelenchus okinawaensis]CAG9112049.1 unnamed protein product [Bursaphelenchus okinawaensis]